MSGCCPSPCPSIEDGLQYVEDTVLAPTSLLSYCCMPDKRMPDKRLYSNYPDDIHPHFGLWCAQESWWTLERGQLNCCLKLMLLQRSLQC